MAGSGLDPQEKRRILRMLDQRGPMTHEELAKEMGYDWDKLQRIIRELRKEDLVAITIDRRYEARNETGTAVPA